MEQTPLMAKRDRPTTDVAGSNDAMQGAAEELWEHRTSAFFLAMRILQNRALAEDAVQEAYLNAWKALREGKRPEESRSWFLRVTANCAKTVRRAKTRRDRREDAVRATANATQEPGRADTETEAATAVAALERLEEKLRLPLSLCYEQGLSQRQAAVVLGLSQQAISNYVNRGLEKLRRMLTGDGVKVSSAALPALLAAADAGKAMSLSAPFEAALQKAQVESLAQAARSASVAARSVRVAAATKTPWIGVSIFVVLAAMAGGAWWVLDSNVPQRKGGNVSQKKGGAGLPAEYLWHFDDGMPKAFGEVRVPNQTEAVLRERIGREPGKAEWVADLGKGNSGALKFGAEGGGVVLPVKVPLVSKKVELTFDVKYLDMTASTIATVAVPVGDLPFLDPVKRADRREKYGRLIYSPVWNTFERRTERFERFRRVGQWISNRPVEDWMWGPAETYRPEPAQCQYYCIHGTNVVIDNVRLRMRGSGLLPPEPALPPKSFDFDSGMPDELTASDGVEWSNTAGKKGKGALVFGRKGGRVVFKEIVMSPEIHVEFDIRPRGNARLTRMNLGALTRARVNHNAPPAIDLDMTVDWDKNWKKWAAHLSNSDVQLFMYGKKIKRTRHKHPRAYAPPFRLYIQARDVIIDNLRIRHISLAEAGLAEGKK